jgi:hypothetical protein
LTEIPSCPLRIGDLHVDPQYHRPVDPVFVSGVAHGFNVAVFGALWVNRREDGSLWVMDGRRRLMAARERLGEDARVLCLLFTNLSLAEEAKCFIEQNCCRRIVPVKQFKRRQDEMAKGGPEGASAGRTLVANFQRANLSLEDLRRAQVVAGMSDHELKKLPLFYMPCDDDGHQTA